MQLDLAMEKRVVRRPGSKPSALNPVGRGYAVISSSCLGRQAQVASAIVIATVEMACGFIAFCERSDPVSSVHEFYDNADEHLGWAEALRPNTNHAVHDGEHVCTMQINQCN
jgi:hypothetical protein